MRRPVRARPARQDQPGASRPRARGTVPDRERRPRSIGSTASGKAPQAQSSPRSGRGRRASTARIAAEIALRGEVAASARGRARIARVVSARRRRIAFPRDAGASRFLTSSRRRRASCWVSPPALVSRLTSPRRQRASCPRAAHLPSRHAPSPRVVCGAPRAVCCAALAARDRRAASRAVPSSARSVPSVIDGSFLGFLPMERRREPLPPSAHLVDAAAGTRPSRRARERHVSIALPATGNVENLQNRAQKGSCDGPHSAA